MRFYVRQNGEVVECATEEEYKTAVEGVYDITTKVKYGREEGVIDKWKSIIEIENREERNKKIDELLVVLELNKNENSFFAADDIVYINAFCSFKVDDREIYYLFFENLREIIIADNNKTKDQRNLITKAINKTLFEYFGTINPNKMSERENITDNNDDTKQSSIKDQKGKQTAMCTERSVLTHNLWLLVGETSYWIDSNDFYMKENSKTTMTTIDGTGHAFSVVSIVTEKNGEKVRVYCIDDNALNIWAHLSPTFLEDLKNGVPIEVKAGNKHVVYTEGTKFCNAHKL